ncbi:RusA family crossover junction endodeoxyribonuclease [Bradyrhizobium sp.]
MVSSAPPEQLPLPNLGPTPLVVGPIVVCFELPGDPRPKARHRSRIAYKGKTPFVMQYPEPETAAYERVIGQLAAFHMRGKQPTDKPVALIVHVFKSIPVSWPARDREAALAGAIRPDGRIGDWDNFGKACSDAMNGIVYHDDCQVIDGRCLKFYSDRPALRVEVREYIPASNSVG